MSETTHVRISQRDKARLDDLKDSDESNLMAVRAAINALEEKRDNGNV